MNKDTRIIYDKDYYTLQAILNSEKFIEFEVKFRSTFDKSGIPVPLTGFKSVKEYDRWKELAWNKNLNYGWMIDDILEKFGITTKKDTLHLGLILYFFFGKKEAPIEFTHEVECKLAPDKSYVDCRLKIYTQTRKDDIVDDFWDKAAKLQKQLKDHKPRNRDWDTFERDFELYQLFLRVKKNLSKGNLNYSKDIELKTKSPYIAIVYYPEFEKLKSKYGFGEKLEESLGPIISRCKQNFGNLNLL